MRFRPIGSRLTLLAALTLGVLLHFLYSWMPNPLTALVSPIQESLWEHLKVLFIPLLLAGIFLGGVRGLTPWLCSNLLVCSLMLPAGWFLNVVLESIPGIFNILLYAVLMSAGFYLPRILWPLTEWPGVGAACAILTVLLSTLMVIFTYNPPDHILFADLSYSVRTFIPIPV